MRSAPHDTVDCWGWDDAFQRLGDGSGKSQPPPGVSIVTNAIDLIGSPDGDFECARRADSSLSCWGYPPDCDPSYPDAGYPATPASRPDLSSLNGLALGQQFLCGIQGSSVSCCGTQGTGELGNGVEAATVRNTLAPVLLPSGSRAVAVFVGASYACATLDDTTTWCWGGTATVNLATERWA